MLLSGSYADFEIPDTAGTFSGLPVGERPAGRFVQHQRTPERTELLRRALLSEIRGQPFAQVSAFTRYADIRFSPDPAQDLLFNGNAAQVKTSDFANGLQADASYTLGDHHTLRAGMLATYDLEQLDTEAAVFPASSQFAPSPSGNNLPSPAPQSSSTPFTVCANSGNSGLTSGIYLQDEWQLNERLILNYGVRYDRFDVSFDHEDQISPRANLVWQIDDATSAHVGYARYFMPPTLAIHPTVGWSRHLNTPPTRRSMSGTIRKRSNATIILMRAFPGKSPALAGHPGFVLQARQESPRRRPVWQRGHSQ